MEWMTQILAKHSKEDGTFDLEAAKKEVNQEFPKHAVPKDQYNKISSNLKEANATIQALEEKTKDNPEVQKALDAYQTKAEQLEKENNALKINSQASAALQKAGVKDVDYALFKLGTLELDKEGKVKDLENKVKDLKASIPDYFAQEETEETKAGYQTIDTKLPEGKPNTRFTRAEIENMTATEINQQWEAVSASLQGGNE